MFPHTYYNSDACTAIKGQNLITIQSFLICSFSDVEAGNWYENHVEDVEKQNRENEEIAAQTSAPFRKYSFR
jgi:hypothetical protein